jgi:predicted  nucleic acid-binding Zn-ribbon protein
MKPRFDPDNAVEVEDDIFDRFMEQMSARSQAKQLQQATDALRVLLEMTRKDSESLLSKYTLEFDDMVKKRDILLQAMLVKVMRDATADSESQSKEVIDALEGSIDRVVSRTDNLSTAVGRVEKLVKDLASAPKGVEPDNAAIRGLVAEVAMLRSKIDLPRDDKMGALMDLVRSMKEAVPPKKSWRLSVERDEYARIKNVTATSD